MLGGEEPEHKKLTSIERYFGTVKQSRLMDQHRYIGIKWVSLHVLLSTITYLATALARLQANDYARMQHMRIKLPKEKKQQRQPVPEVAPSVAAALLLHQLGELQKVA